MVEESKDYVDKLVNPFIKELTSVLLAKRPKDIVKPLRLSS